MRMISVLLSALIVMASIAAHAGEPHEVYVPVDGKVGKWETGPFIAGKSEFAPSAFVYLPEDGWPDGPRRVLVTVRPGSMIWVKPAPGTKFQIEDGQNGNEHYTAAMVTILTWVIASYVVVKLVRGDKAL